MRTLIACLAVMLFATASSQAQEIKFAQTEMDYGNIEKGADGVRVFKFTNTGTAPLIIQDAKGSCGCTVPTYPKEPIMPGQSGEISVKYDTQRVGGFTKHVTLTTNAQNESTSVLVIKGEVKSTEAPIAPTLTK